MLRTEWSTWSGTGGRHKPEWVVGITGIRTSDNRVCITTPYEDWVHVIDPYRSEEVLRFRWDHIPDSVPDSIIVNYRGQRAVDQDMEAGARWLCDNLSIMGLVEGPNSEVWVLRSFAQSDDGMWSVDAFSSAGVYRGRVQLPCPAYTIQPFGEYVYGFGRNGEAPALVRYRLIAIDQ